MHVEECIYLLPTIHAGCNRCRNLSLSVTRKGFTIKQTIASLFNLE